MCARDMGSLSQVQHVKLKPNTRTHMNCFVCEFVCVCLCVYVVGVSVSESCGVCVFCCVIRLPHRW